MNSLTQIIKSKESTIGIIGLGYAGLPLAIRFSEEEFKVIGFDIDDVKVNLLNNQESYIKHIKEDDISAMFDQGFMATTDFANISDIDAILICVPTPLGVHNEPDLSYVKSTLNLIKEHLREGQLLILESTTYPGTTAEEIVPVIEKVGFKVGENFYIGYSPEREDPGNKDYTTKTIPKVVSGHTKNCLEVTTALYDQIVDQTVPVSSTQVAEMTKILENIHRAVNIGLVNELKMVADKMNIDINEVIKAAATKPFGFTPYYPGPGLGGHCIPIDPFYLTWKAKEMGINTRFIELAGEINSAMPSYVVSKVTDALNTVGKSISGSKILILGLAYKKNIDDLRESPSLELIELLLEKGAHVDYSDPFIAETHKTRKNDFNMKSISINKESLNSFNLAILATDHDDFDYKLIEKESKLIVDTRGKFKVSKKVIKA
ncbi:MAG: nucleotide sugar dehydrogenase [Candidatus Marinimicrobia bacterium]|jgi:UDP-N-acetyl-D-glucosamine dehydrogenase|nr:nucleotide sugar dehydrogenase [Candidatus Neomarinimicrobiota bacterium]MBT5362964.1 nucleotide sugar dehydrogenase [Candidatus Neomarinimicrobiota bacterium]